MEEKMLIDKETLKAIAVDTRLNILKLLAKKKYTLSELAQALGLGSSTILEHMEHLLGAELVEKEQTDRKWKFYSITLKGRRFVEPREIKVLFMFALSTVGAIAAAVWFAMKASVIEKAPILMAKTADEGLLAAAPLAEEAAGGVQDMALRSMPEQTTALSVAQPINPWVIFGIMVVLIGVSAFLLGYYMKKKTVIIQQREKR
jgi:DNA-binding transcriptional ArsR family regulator